VIILEQESEVTSAPALKRFALKAQRAIGLQGEVSIRITTSRELQELNRRFRKKNKPTDVLSFPSCLPEIAGDIAISSDIATGNAAELGHTLATELRVLILHGLLHLAGHDHEADQGQMRSRENALRKELGLPVGLIERAHGDGWQRSVAKKKHVPRSAGDAKQKRLKSAPDEKKKGPETRRRRGGRG
jgi:probable rRNA maturation factor